MGQGDKNVFIKEEFWSPSSVFELKDEMKNGWVVYFRGLIV